MKIRKAWRSVSQKIRQAWRSSKCFLKNKSFGKRWIAKKDMYPNQDQSPMTEDLICNHVTVDGLTCDCKDPMETAYTFCKTWTLNAWYFDSGCS